MQDTKPIGAAVVAKSAARFTEIKTLLASIDATITVHRAEILEQLSSVVQQLRPHIITIYLDSITAADLEQIRRIRALIPTSAVIAIMTPTNPQEVDSLLQAGADDCLDIQDESRLRRVLKVHLANQRFREELERRSQEFNNLTQKLNFYIQNTTEGIWCFEPPEPIPLDLPTEEKVTRSFEAICVECNNAYAAMFGLQRSDLLGRKLADLMPDNEINRAYLTQFFENDNYIENAESLEYDPQGNEKHFLNSMYAEIEDGRLVRAWGRQVDITHERRRAADIEKALQRFRAVWESSLDGLCILDSQGHIVQANPAFCQMVGKKQEEIEAQPLSSLFHYTPRKQINHQHLSFWDQQIKAYHQLHDVTLWNGSRRQFEITSTALTSDQGEGLILSIFHDVSEERKSAQRLAEISQRFQWLYEYAPSGYHILKPDGTIVDVNTKWCQMMGYSKEEVIGRPIFDFVVPREKEASKRSFQRKIESRVRFTQPTERVFQTRSGQEITCLIHDYFTYDEDENLVQVLTTIQDISERKRMEQELHERDRQMATLIDNIPGLVYRCKNDRDWTMDYLSPACKEITGYEPAELIGNQVLSFNDLIHPDHRQRLWEKWQQLLPQRAVFEDEYPITTKNGETRWVWERGRGVFDDQGNVLFLEGIITDVTARRQMEEELKRERALLRTVLDNLPDAIYAKDTACRKTLTNVVDLHNLGGKTEAEVLGKDDFAFYPKDVAEAFYRDDRYVLDTGNPIINCEEKIHYADGGEGYLLTSKVPLRDENGQIIGLVGIGHDITERKKTELALRESEAKFRALAESSPAAIFIYQQNRFVYVNPATEKLTGCTQEQLMQLNFWDVVHPDFRELVKERGLARQRGEPVPSHYEFKIITPNGEERWIDFAGAVTTFAGQPAAIGFAYDVTERKQVEEALRESEERFRRLAENAQDLIYRYEFIPKRRFTYVSPIATIMTGYTPEDHYADPDLGMKLIHPEDLPLLEKYFQGQGVFREPLVLRWVRKDGTILWTEQRNVPIFDEAGNLVAIEGIARDITERKQAEEKIRQSEETYRNLFQNAQVGLFRTRIADGKILECNDQLAHMFGYDSREEFIAEYVTSQNYVDAGTHERMLEMLRRDGFVQNFEARFYRKDRSIFWARFSARIYPKEGWIEGVAEDITARKQAEEALGESEEKLRLLVENMVEVFFQIDLHGRLSYINPAIERMLGFSPEEVLGKEYTDFILGENKERLRREIAAQAQGRQVFRLFELNLLHKNGSLVVAEISAAPIISSDGTFRGYVGVCRDITEQRKLEEERSRLAKLESLSILAGGIAHDFNNLLTGIMGNISLAKMKNKDQNLGPVLERAERASVRARDLTQQLLTFAKGGEPIREDVPLPELVRESAEFICRGKPVKLEYRFNPDLPPAHVDPGQISQVVQNLVLNSVQAMPHGGTITIAPEQIESPSDLPLEPGRYLKLQVRDTGVGIPEKIIDRIFDPYFSTKQSGSGLGLAIVHSILKRHHAHITVHSRYGEGTTFTIYLPAGEGLPKDKQASTETAAPSGGRVLLMDDEDLVLEVGRAMLENLGYEVETAPEGQKALAMYRAAREAGKPFDVVIMDLTIAGGLGGKETVMELKKYDPQARAIVSSGYSNDPIMANPAKYGFDDVVDKPYDVQKLHQAILRTMRRLQT